MNPTKPAVNPVLVPYAAALAVSLLALPLFAFNTISQTPVPRAAGQNDIVEADPAPSAAQIHALMSIVIENQHHDDEALGEFERTEHVISRKSEASDPVADHTNRLIPSGTGVTRFEIERDGMPISRELYRQHLQVAIDALELALQPNSQEKQDLTKFQRRRRERSELVDTTLQAFDITWAGRETRGTQTLAKFLLSPNPEFKPTTRLAEVFRHVQAAMWVDESAKQIARIEGDITSDVTFGGGIVGKLYRGGHFVIEQLEVAPGVWEPSLVTYDVRGREVFVGVSIHERTETSHYKHLGRPEDAIEILRGELNTVSQAWATQKPATPGE